MEARILMNPGSKKLRKAFEARNLPIRGCFHAWVDDILSFWMLDGIFGIGGKFSLVTFSNSSHSEML